MPSSVENKISPSTILQHKVAGISDDLKFSFLCVDVLVFGTMGAAVRTTSSATNANAHQLVLQRSKVSIFNAVFCSNK